MNPAVVIPSYWSHDEHLGVPGTVTCFDHATPIDTKTPQLNDCLASLRQVEGMGQVIVLVVAPPDVEEQAVHRVRQICNANGFVSAVIVDSYKAAQICQMFGEVLPPELGEPVGVHGYGAIRNMGLLACCALDCDVAVFIDDDEVVLSSEFLADAVYGLGQVPRSGVPIVAKSGYFLDRRNSALADRNNKKSYDKHWGKRAEFNSWMTQAQAGPRISRSNVMCGGCFALHAEAFTRIAFDPYITRGEDLDYLLNMRLYGMDVWFDNRWRVRHMPPRLADRAPRFLQDVYRWTYEHSKLEICNSNIDLHKLEYDQLMPYPGPWLGPELPKRISRTALKRAICTHEKAAYWQIYRQGRKDAEAYAEANCTRYLEFQRNWPTVASYAWRNESIRKILESEGLLNAQIAAAAAQAAGLDYGAYDAGYQQSVVSPASTYVPGATWTDAQPYASGQQQYAAQGQQYDVQGQYAQQGYAAQAPAAQAPQAPQYAAPAPAAQAPQYAAPAPQAPQAPVAPAAQAPQPAPAPAPAADQAEAPLPTQLPPFLRMG